MTVLVLAPLDTTRPPPHMPWPCRVKEEGLALPWDAGYMALLNGTSGQSVEEYVAGLKAAEQAKKAW